MHDCLDQKLRERAALPRDRRAHAQKNWGGHSGRREKGEMWKWFVARRVKCAAVAAIICGVAGTEHSCFSSCATKFLCTLHLIHTLASPSLLLVILLKLGILGAVCVIRRRRRKRKERKKERKKERRTIGGRRGACEQLLCSTTARASSATIAAGTWVHLLLPRHSYDQLAHLLREADRKTDPNEVVHFYK